MALIFAAAKAAEVAPGVGGHIDVAIVFENHVEDLRPDLATELLELYKRYDGKYKELGLNSIYELRDFIATLPEKIPMQKQSKALNQTRKLMGTLLRQSPKPHEQMRLGKARRRTGEAKKANPKITRVK